MARTYYDRSFGYPGRLGTVPYRRVKPNAFLLADSLHLSIQLARVVRHDFAHPFLGFVLCYGLECLEGFRLEPQWSCVHRTSVVVHNGVLVFPTASRFHLHWPGDVGVYSTQVFFCAIAPFLMREVYCFRCDTCSAHISSPVGP